MSRKRRAYRQNLSFTAAFALIQALRDPSSEKRDTTNYDSQNDSSRSNEAFFKSQESGRTSVSESYEHFNSDFLNTLSQTFLSEKGDREKRNRP